MKTKKILINRRKKSNGNTSFYDSTLFHSIIVIVLSIFIFNLNYLNSITRAQDRPNRIDDKNLIWMVGEGGSDSIVENFDYGIIRIIIKIDVSYSLGVLSYNITSTKGIEKEGIITNELDFVFKYTSDCVGCRIRFKNIGNVTLKWDALMYLETYPDPEIINLIFYFIIIAVIITLAIVIIYSYKRKSNKQ